MTDDVPRNVCMSDTNMASVTRRFILEKKRALEASNQKCQKCLEVGHWTYQCTNKRKYLHRPSRTSIMNKERKTTGKPELKKRQQEGLNKIKKRKQTSSSDDEISSSPSEDDSSSLDSSSSNDSDSSSDSDISSASSSSNSSAVSDSSSSSDSSSDSETDSSTAKPRRKKKRRE